ncbi:hypothetical protein MEX01_49050 [Methylorubrum extorquens]|nr:hypothetical protein MEX01_49050 [Methylorubrum extorquens]
MRALIPAYRLAHDVAGPGELPAPPARTGKAAPKTLGCSMPRRPSLVGMDHAPAQIDEQG